MRYALLALALLTTPASALDIYNDRGGRVVEYHIRYANAQRPIRILGTCASACTLALRYPDTCVGPGAKLIFHRATNEAGTQFLRKYYPRNVRAWFDVHARTQRLVVMPRETMRKLVRRCAS